MTDGDDVGLQPFREHLVGDSLRMAQYALEERKDLLVIVAVQVQTELIHAFLFLILLICTLASSPFLVIFF